MKKLSFIAVLITVVMLSGKLYSQTQGSITEKDIIKIKSSFSNTGQWKALSNAISNNDIQKLALNRENLKAIDKHFSHKVETSGITNQKSTGRCWLFTGLNVLKPHVLKNLNVAEFEFSHNYNFFWDQFEKANLFYEGIIETSDKPMNDRKVEWLFKNSIGDGGQWTGVVNIIEKYGVVPKEIMPESQNSENTRWISRLIRRKLKEDGLTLRKMHADGKKINEIREKKMDMLTEVYRMLAVAMGEPPSEFQWRYKDKTGKLSDMKTYTPKSFYNEVVKVNLRDYIMFMNDPSREYGKLYEIDYDRHMKEGDNWKYINLENEKIKQFALASIKDNEAMYFSCDVGKQLNKDIGTLDVDNFNYGELFGVNFGMDKKERIQTFESGSSHGMTLMAVDVNAEGKIKKWLLENSWGPVGHNGYLIMTDEWFDEYMFRLVIHKKYISDDVLKILEQKPILLPPWDPMFLNEQ
jgi:bleomycin hydrolase